MKKKILPNILSGFATAMFSIPEGMAYAKLAGVNPIYGLYSGIVATIAASLSTGTILMISTLTSAIAISTKSVLDVSEIPSHQIPDALFTLTFLIGAIMLVLGLLRLGTLINFVSNAVLTGFVAGASTLIFIGELGGLVGYHLSGHDKFAHLLDWVTHIHDWDPLTTSIGFGSFFLMCLIYQYARFREAATIIVLILGTFVVYLLDASSIELVKDIAKIPSGFPNFVTPDPVLMPKLALGALSVAMISLIQGAGVSMALPNKRGEKSHNSKDFIGQGIGNLFGSFFQSMGTGGSLSRSAVSVAAGSTNRLGGFFAGIWLIGLLYLFSGMIERVPIAVMSGILCFIAIELILKRWPDIKLIFRSSWESALVMIVTYLSALFIPLQWTIFLGAGLSLLFYIYTSATHIKLFQLIKSEKGYYQEQPVPEAFPSNEITVLQFQGNLFFGEIPVVKNLMPSTEGTKNAIIIWRMRGFEDAHSTYLKWMKQFAEELQSEGNTLMLEGVEPHLMKVLRRTGLLKTLGEENIFMARLGIWESLEEALNSASNNALYREESRS